jgi:hypothetical protein
MSNLPDGAEYDRNAPWFDREWDGRDAKECFWCGEAYHEDSMIKRKEDSELYCHEDCIEMQHQFEVKEYGEEI